MFGQWDEKKILLVVTSIAIFLAVWLVLAVVKHLAWKRLAQLAAQTEATWDDALLKAVRLPIHFFIFLVALSIGVHAIPTKLQSVQSFVLFNKIAFILAASWLVDRVFGVIIRESVSSNRLGSSGKSLLLGVVRLIYFSIVVLIVLDTLGISITPLLASLGVGSIAVALALQDTLGNLFSGLYMLVDRPVRIGDYVLVQDGVEGFVRQIGWRSSRLESPTGSLVVLPNSKLSSAILTNFNLPVRECLVRVTVGVSYKSDLNHVETTLIDEGKRVQQSVPGGVYEFIPIVRFLAFADSSITVVTSLKAASYDDIGPLRHAFIKAIHRRFAEEKIEIPFPTQVVFHQQS